jgi:LEA14-like dessication related protein
VPTLALCSSSGIHKHLQKINVQKSSSKSEISVPNPNIFVMASTASFQKVTEKQTEIAEKAKLANPKQEEVVQEKNKRGFDEEVHII